MSRPDDETPVDGGFLGRWARRKQEVQRETAAPARPDDPAAGQGPQDEVEDLPLPSLDSIVPGSDVTAFLAKHVPDALRTAALRKLWVTDPDIKGFIEMADYQWDFNNPDSIPGWSSSVEGIDIKKMMERVLGEDRTADAVPTRPTGGSKDAPETHIEPETAQIDGDQPIGENTESAMKSVASDGLPAASDHSLIQNDAVQNSTNESSVYDVVRKRGGGALPT